MAYIQTNNSLPGILELLYYKESTGKALSALAHTLLHGPSNLTPAERELIAAHVSSLNQCSFCAASHGAAASAHLKDEGALAAAVQSGSLDALSLSSKMKQLLELASLVQKGGREIKPQNVEAARSAGASDEEIHDAISDCIGVLHVQSICGRAGYGRCCPCGGLCEDGCAFVKGRVQIPAVLSALLCEAPSTEGIRPGADLE